MRYVHTLLFDCPQCKFPIAISLIKEQQNLEEIDAETLFIMCSHCQHAFSTLAITAKRHYVDEWPFKNLP